MAKIKDIFEEAKISLTVMKHCIGIDSPYASCRTGRFMSFRNFYCTDGDNEIWEELVKEGYATKSKPEPYVKYRYYHVSEKGIKVLEEVMDIKITFGDKVL